MTQALIGARIFDGECFLHHHAVIHEAGKVVGVVTEDELPVTMETVNLNGGVLAPGFVDLQANGGGGVLFNNDTSAEAIECILKGHRSAGTTSVMLTLMTDTQQRQRLAVEAYNRCVESGVAGMLGLHFEGPFFNLSRSGVHNKNWIRQSEQEDIDWLLSLQGISLIVTLAPERTDPSHIKALTDAGIRVCVGHTEATYDETNLAIANGASGFTHLYNAMRPLQSREPGVVGAALRNADTWCGIIVDGHHVHSGSVFTAYSAKPKGKLYLVSDAMATVGSDEKSFELYGETIREENGRLVNSVGRLAGSAIGLIDAVKTSVQAVGIPLNEALRMASLYPAEYMQLDSSIGRLRENFNADMVHFDENFNVQNTWVAGVRYQYNAQ
jgi:N-acetylglucosamine-6-phosphate deacetylase